LDKGVSIIQIPCPSSQDYRRVSRKVLREVRRCMDNEVNVLGVISREFSPICGVHKVKKGNKTIPGKGSLIKEIENGMRKQKFQIPIIPANLNNGLTTLRKLEKLLKSV
jgi:predicted secreted protein